MSAAEARAAVARLHALAGRERTAFEARHRAALDAWRGELSAALPQALAELRAQVHALTGGDASADALATQAAEYVDWMQWALWDLPALAVALPPEPDAFRRRVTGCGLVYLSFRLVDDLLDRHYLYRGRRETLLASFTRTRGEGAQAEGLTLLGALLVAFQGLARLADDADPTPLRAALEAARRALIGALFERSERQQWDARAYARLVSLKNVDYGRILLAALDPAGRSALRPFLDAALAFAQRLNDVQDQPADEARGQPNFVSALRADGGTRADLEAALAREALALGDHMRELAGRERGVAASQLAALLDEARRLGLFAEGAPAADDGGAEATSGLSWDASAEEFLERHGPDALDDAPCGACGARDPRLLFRLRGFAFQRCQACTHAYVSPRLTAALRARLAREHDGHGDDPFLDVQRLQAEHLCRVLRRYARGPRLLDVGFGRGFLLHLAQAYGFEAYGVDDSATRLAEIAPVFGRRLARADAAAGPLPFGAFDVLVLSHVLEHVADPGALLRHARAALNDDGLLYVAVPEAGCVQWRLFGKHWEAVHPVVHLHYFTQASLEGLAARCGFELLSRVEPRPEPAIFATRATRLYRELGGSEAGELALLWRAKREAT